MPMLQHGKRKSQPALWTGCDYRARVDEFPTLESHLAKTEPNGGAV